VIIADVSGHGLATGLRMAMLKAALLILVEQTRDPGEILARLDRVVRMGAERRYFVTATLGILDLESGALSLTNAGHPPTYRIRGEQVDEVLIPGSALGGLGHTYGHVEITLAPGDIVVWLSDGLIEASNSDDEPFGYDQVIAALRPPNSRQLQTAATMRDRLLAAVERHADGQPPADDRTLVVLRWGGPKERVNRAAQREASAVRTEATEVAGAGVLGGAEAGMPSAAKIRRT
jgi:sigma-B regulation protein RsbU (phosphoserine phosphatase)